MMRRYCCIIFGVMVATYSLHGAHFCMAGPPVPTLPEGTLIKVLAVGERPSEVMGSYELSQKAKKEYWYAQRPDESDEDWDKRDRWENVKVDPETRNPLGVPLGEKIEGRREGTYSYDNRVIAADWTHYRSGQFDFISYSAEGLIDGLRRTLKQRQAQMVKNEESNTPLKIAKLAVDGHYYAKAGGGKGLNNKQIKALAEMLADGAVIERHGCFAASYESLYRPWIKALRVKGGVFGGFTGMTVGAYGDPKKPSRPSPYRALENCLWIITDVAQASGSEKNPIPEKDGHVCEPGYTPPQDSRPGDLKVLKDEPAEE